MRTTNIALIIAVAALLGVSAYKAFNTPADLPNIKVMFEKWSQEHGKAYNSPTEKNFRLKIFFKNYLKIKAINMAKLHWKAGLNQFSDMTEEEVEAKYFGYIPKTERNEAPIEDDISALPAAIDWRDKGMVNPVKNQANCGSCWAFSTIASLESNYAISFGKLQQLSEQQLVDCSTSYGNHGCNGGLMDNAFKYIEKKGVTTEASYPYKAVDQQCNTSAEGQPAAWVDSYFDIPRKSNDQLKSSAAKRVVSVAIHANPIVSYKSGVFHSYCGTQLNHGVAVVGYGNDSSSGLDYWIVRNSWGQSWGNNGYIWMVRVSGNHDGVCGIALAASYPVPKQQ